MEGKVNAAIEKGLLVLLGIEDADTEEDISWLSGKIVNLRIFDDANGVMNESILDQGGDIILVSQFTLHASTKKENLDTSTPAGQFVLTIFAAEDERAGVTFFHRAAPDGGITGEPGKIYLLLLRLGFLKADDIGIAFGEVFTKAFVERGADAVDVPGGEFHAEAD